MEGDRVGQGTGTEHCSLTWAPSGTWVTGVSMGGGGSDTVGRQRWSKMFPTSRDQKKFNNLSRSERPLGRLENWRWDPDAT